MNIKVGVSSRHIHLSKEVKDILFGSDYELSKKNDLSQTGEYSTKETIDIRTEKADIKKVRVLGPLRNHTQLEISKTDSYVLGINPPVRNSEDLNESESIYLIGPNGMYYLNEGVIISTRHIHMTQKEAEILNLKDMDKVSVKVKGEKSGILNDVYIKVKNTYTLELHLDTDDANAFLLKTGDEVELIRKD